MERDRKESDFGWAQIIEESAQRRKAYRRERIGKTAKRVISDVLLALLLLAGIASWAIFIDACIHAENIEYVENPK